MGSFRLPNNDAGAARVLNVARALRMAGNEVSFISLGGSYRTEDLGEDGVYRVDGFPYIITDELDISGGLMAKCRGWLRRGRKAKKIVKNHIREYDVIISYGVEMALWLHLICKRYKIKHICDITEWHDNNEFRWPEIPLYHISMYLILPCVKNIIVISSYLNEYFSKSNNIIIPATCDKSEKKWHQDNKQVLRSVGPYDGITLIYAGTPARKDAVHYVIRAVNRLSSENEKIRLLILGINKELYTNLYSDFLPPQDISSQIIFMGRLSQDDVPSYYSISDFMILIREQTRKSNAGFPTKFAESFTSGTPVIANITSDLGQYLEDGVTGFVVSEPNEDAVYRVLKEKVLKCDKEQLGMIKRNVIERSELLDYHFYIEPLKFFMSNLK